MKSDRKTQYISSALSREIPTTRYARTLWRTRLAETAWAKYRGFEYYYNYYHIINSGREPTSYLSYYYYCIVIIIRCTVRTSGGSTYSGNTSVRHYLSVKRCFVRLLIRIYVWDTALRLFGRPADTRLYYTYYYYCTFASVWAAAFRERRQTIYTKIWYLYNNIIMYVYTIHAFRQHCKPNKYTTKRNAFVSYVLLLL